MDLSGIIFVVLALVWAGYLIPKALKHHDEVARTRPIDRFSSAMRVLARREPVGDRDARLVVTPARAPGRGSGAVTAPVAVAAPGPGAASPVSRAAARAAARRRRRILTFLLLCGVVVGGLAYRLVVPRWSAAVPVALTLLYLVLCRAQARREPRAGRDTGRAARSREVEVEDHAAPQVATGVVEAARNEQGFEEYSPNEETMTIPAVLDVAPAMTADAGSLWDPLPVTLPTYVTKPKARRTVRTIDLDEPGTWTSGHHDADTSLVKAATEEAARDAAEAARPNGQRAVSS